MLRQLKALFRTQFLLEIQEVNYESKTTNEGKDTEVDFINSGAEDAKNYDTDTVCESIVTEGT